MLMTPKRSILAGMLAITLFFGCSGSGLMSKEKVATVNDAAITRAEFDETYTRTMKMMRLDEKTMKDPKYQAMADMFKKMTMDALILQSLVEQEAEKRKLVVTDADVDKTYNTQVRDLGGEKVVNEQLSKMGLSAKDYKEQLKLQLLRDKLVSAIAGDKVKVSEAEARKFYNTHTNQFNEPEQVKARHILIAADRKQVEQDIKKIKPTASQAEIDKQVEATLADKKKKAEQILAEVKLKPADFPRLAEKNSDDTASAKQGGDLGYFSKETMVQPFSEAAFSTKPGQIHDKLVVSPFGYHIVEVLDRKAPRSRSFDEVKTQLITFLENSKRSQTMEEWLQKEKQTAKIDIKPEYDFGKAEAHGPSQAADAKAGKK